MKLAPATLATSLVVVGAIIAGTGVLMRVPSYESLQVVSGTIDRVDTRRTAMAEPTENLRVDLSVVAEGGIKQNITFKQPESRQTMLHALGGRRIVARLGPDGDLYELRVDQVAVQTYMQTVQPMFTDKAWLAFCGVLFAGLGLIGLWLTRYGTPLRKLTLLDGTAGVRALPMTAPDPAA